MNFEIREATEEDCREVSRMIMELAIFLNMPDQVKISHEANVIISSYIEVNESCAGFACLTPKCEKSCSVTVSARIPSLNVSLQKCLKSKNQKKFHTCDHSGLTVVGYALYFYTYSTWKGRTVYLEDLYVMPEFRGKGIGKGLLSKVAAVGKKKQCVRLQLSVLDWNTPARDFYAAKGAQDITDSEGRHFICFHRQSLDNLAKEAPED